MNYLLFAFPLAIAAILGLHHLFAFLLWLAPSSTVLWMALMWTRGLVSDIDTLFGMMTGLTSTQALIVLALCILLAAAVRGRVRIWSATILNHALALLLVAAPFTFHHVQASLALATPLDIGSIAVARIIGFEYGVLAYFGILACIVAQVAFLRTGSRRYELSTLQLKYRCNCL